MSSSAVHGMMRGMPCRRALTLLLAILGAQTATCTLRAQHCGGPCEVMRGAKPRPNGKYSLTTWHWAWQENNRTVHKLKALRKKVYAAGFGYHRAFPSPAGNGFLVTGNPYSFRRAQKANPSLFVFYSPRGKSLLDLGMLHVLRPKERKLGKCPSCHCCEDVLHVFEKDPALSPNACFVELTAVRSLRKIAFFLPLPVPVFDRARFESILTSLEWRQLGDARREKLEAAIARDIAALQSEAEAERQRASEALLARGYLARDALRKAREASSSESFRALVSSLEARLRPWQHSGWPAMRRDLDLLRVLVSDTRRLTAEAAKRHLDTLLPHVREMGIKDALSWLDENTARLDWNKDAARYELR